MGSLPSNRTLTVSKDALKKLSNAAIDFDVRPNELANAIVILTDWERHTDKLVGYIKKDREKRLGSLPGPVPGPVPGSLPGHTDSRVLSGLSRVSPGSLPGPEKSEKNAKTTREDPGRVLPGSPGSSEEEKT
jgi:hypothetical protein